MSEESLQQFSGDQSASNTTESNEGETSHLLSQIEEIRKLSDTFPYIPSSEHPGDRNYWIKEYGLEHWKENYDTWNTEWGVISRGHKFNELPVEIAVTGPSRDNTSLTVSIYVDYGQEMTYEEEQELEKNPLYRTYEFDKEGRITKKKQALGEPVTVEQMLPGDYKTLQIALDSVKNALIEAKI